MIRDSIHMYALNCDFRVLFTLMFCKFRSNLRMVNTTIFILYVNNNTRTYVCNILLNKVILQNNEWQKIRFFLLI